MSTPAHSNAAAHLITGDAIEQFDVLGPTIQFLMAPAEAGDIYCIMRGVIAPGVFVPLHSHADFETFVVVSGELYQPAKALTHGPANRVMPTQVGIHDFPWCTRRSRGWRAFARHDEGESAFRRVGIRGCC
jgi:hypothetical protein